MSRSVKQIVIRDARSRKMYRVDDSYIDDGYARVCKPAATAVYNSLCRHADTNQESWPSIERIMEQHGMGKNTVLRALKVLEKWRIITVLREKDPKTKRQMVNVYVLVDRSDWGALPGAKSEPGAGFQNGTDPGAKNDQKPGAATELEGSTVEGSTEKGVGADAPDSPTQEKCKTEKCNKSPIKDRDFCKEHQSMSCIEFVAWYRKSDRRYINLIAEFADEVKPDFETVAQWEIWASKHYTAAKELSAFSDEQVAKAYARTKEAGYITEFNLWTVIKFLTNTSKK